MVIARKIAYNVLVSSISKILATVLALVSIGLITRYLGKDGFGNYSTVIAFFAFFIDVILIFTQPLRSKDGFSFRKGMAHR